MGMSLVDYDDITLTQFINKLTGFYNYQNQQVQKMEWMRTQYIAYSILVNNAYIKPKDKPKSFEAFLNGSTKSKTQTDQEKLEAFKKFQQMVKKHEK